MGVQHIVSVLADWLAAQVQKTKKGSRGLIWNGCSAQSSIMWWSFAIPIQVNEHNASFGHPLQLIIMCNLIHNQNHLQLSVSL